MSLRSHSTETPIQRLSLVPIIVDIRDHSIQSIHNFERLIIATDGRVIWVLKEPAKSQESFHHITYFFFVAYARFRKCQWPNFHDHPRVTRIARIKETKTSPVVGKYMASSNTLMCFDCTEITHEFQGRPPKRELPMHCHASEHEAIALQP